MRIKTRKLFALFPKGKEKKLMVIFSHPDDESFLVGGTLAKAKKEAIDTAVVVLSHGERGNLRLKKDKKELGRLRQKEFEEACQILGVDKAFILNFPDLGFQKVKSQLQSKIEQLIRQERPAIIITHDPSGGYGHPDHIITSFLVKNTVSQLGEKGRKINLYFPILKAEPTKKQPKFMPKPTVVIDVSLFAKQKAKACQKYRSQVPEGKLVFFEEIFSRISKKEFLHQVDFRKKYLYPEICPLRAKGPYLIDNDGI